MARETSIATYREIEANGLLSRTRFEVYSSLFNEGEATAGELFQRLDWAIKGSVCSRLNELRQMGCVEEKGIRACGFSGKSAIVWDVTRNLPRKLVKKPIVRRQDLLRLLLVSYDELLWCHDSLFKQMAAGNMLSKAALKFMERVRRVMLDIEEKINIKKEKEKKNG